MKNTKRPGWSRLDNAAKVFPALANKKDSRVFRFACQLTEPVQKKALQQAAEQALEEFPIFTNIIRHGMFWYYLEESGEMPIVHEEDQNVCSRLYDKNEHHLLIDISYYKCRINFEVFHAMADATGALMFLKTLVVNYLKIVHPVLAHEDLSLGIDSTFREKDSDSFSQYYNKEEKNSSMSFLGEKTVPIFHFHEPSTPDFFQQVTEAEVSTRQIIAAAKQYHTTVTVFLVSLLILSIYDAMEPRDRKKAVRIMVPVNLRNYFPSATVRNFFGLIAVTYDRKKQGETLEDVIAAVAENFRRELTKEKLEKMIAGQVSLEKHMAARAIPLIFKDIGMELSGLIAGARQTMYFSNIGRITMPKALAPYVCQFDFFIGCAGRQICMCSYEDHMMVTCAGSSSPKDTERAFFRRLAEFDSDMIINTNYSGKEERVYCPLCKKRIIDEGTEDSSIKEDFDVFPVTQKKQADFIFMKIVTFTALAAVIVAGMVDRMMVLSDRTWQPIFFLVVIGVAGGYALLIVGQRKWKNIRKMVMYEVIIGMILCIAYDWYTGWKGWSVQIVLPLTVVGMNLLYFILGFVDRKHQTDYGIYFLLTIIATVFVVILVCVGVMHNTMLVTVTTGIGVLLLIAKIIFQGKTFLSELSRRLHV